MRVELNIPINRVEGDLDIEVAIEDGVIVDAKSKGTLYRGFENILKGRHPLDALVITPRVCGICSISHLIASAKALENAFGITPPPQAVRLRNLSLMAETLQSDLRQHFLMYMVDFATPFYKSAPFFERAKERYAPVHGVMSKKILEITKEVLKIIAIIGGQWPHTSHVVPGGITNVIDLLEISEIKNYLVKVRHFLEKEIYGVELEAVLEWESVEQLQKDMQKELAFFVDLMLYLGYEERGRSGYGFVTYGAIDDPDDPKKSFIPAGTSDGSELNIYEDCSHAFFEECTERMNRAQTKVAYPKDGAYSWAKAPRIDGKVYQTGPLAEMVVAKEPLFMDLVARYGDSSLSRQLARLLRPARWVKMMEEMAEAALKEHKAPVYVGYEMKDGAGVGLSAAARGALGHWVRIEDRRIANYQIISPTTWNASPRDSEGQSGPFEKALLGEKIANVEDPVEIGHIIRSFDPCLVCTVHYIEGSKRV